MISKKDIQKAAKKIFKRQKGLRDHQMIHPQREWLTGLVLGGVLLIAGVAWSATTYVAVDERDVDGGVNQASGQTVYREDIVEFALSEFRLRAENYAGLLSRGSALSNETIEEETDVETPDIETDEEIAVETEATSTSTVDTSLETSDELPPEVETAESAESAETDPVEVDESEISVEF